MPSSIFSNFRNLVEKDPCKAFKGILESSEIAREAEQWGNHQNSACKSRLIVGISSYKALLERLENRREAEVSGAKGRASQLQSLESNMKSFDDNIAKCERVLNESTAQMRAIGLKEGLIEPINDANSLLERKAAESGLKDKVDNLQATLQKMATSLDEVRIIDYNQLYISLYTGKTPEERANADMRSDTMQAAFRAGMDSISSSNDFLRLAAPGKYVLHDCAEFNPVLNFLNALAGQMIPQEWVKNLMSGSLPEADLSSLDKAALGKALKACTKLPVPSADCKREAERVNSLLVQYVKERETAQKNIRGYGLLLGKIKANPHTEAFAMHNLTPEEAMSDLSDEIKMAEMRLEFLESLIAIATEIKRIYQLTNNANRSFIQAVEKSLVMLPGLRGLRESKAKASARMQEIMESGTVPVTESIDLAIARAKARLAAMNDELSIILSKERMGREREKRRKEARLARKDAASNPNPDSMLAVQTTSGNSHLKSTSSWSPAPSEAKHGSIATQYSELKGKAILSFIRACHSAFGEFAKSTPSEMVRFDRTLRRLAECYIKNKGALHFGALTNEFGRSARKEDLPATNFKIIRVSFDKEAFFRVLLEVSGPRTPVLLFAGPKNGANGSDAYLAHKRYVHDVPSARKDGRANLFPMLDSLVPEKANENGKDRNCEPNLNGKPGSGTPNGNGKNGRR